MRDIEGEAETQEEGEAGSTSRARRGTQSRDPRTAPQAKGRRQTAKPPRDPPVSGFTYQLKSFISWWNKYLFHTNYEIDMVLDMGISGEI